jgi:pyroglutamyl-peptidase
MLNNVHEPPLKTTLKVRPAARMLRIAITGFGPFPGVPFNASERLIADLGQAPRRLPQGAQLYTAALPTDWRLARDALADFMDDVKPHVALHFGVSSRAKGFVIETRAYNQTSGRADCMGRLAQERRVRRGAPAQVETRMPAARLVQRLRMEGIPAQLSTDPGRYLCNAVMFESVCRTQATGAGQPGAAEWGLPLAGFVHIPALGPAGMPCPAGRFGWPELRRGAEIILDMLVRLPRRPYGAARSGRPCISLR